jgi:nicotinamide riboside kinase
MDTRIKNQTWILAGAESSGKTSLFDALIPLFPNFHFVSEYNREWLQNRQLTHPFNPGDITLLFEDSIRYYQKKTFDDNAILDTDLLNLMIWAESINHPMLSELRSEWNKKENTVYILCPPNIPYVKDPLRSNEITRQWAWKRHLEWLQNRKHYILQSDHLHDRIQEVQTILSQHV